MHEKRIELLTNRVKMQREIDLRKSGSSLKNGSSSSMCVRERK